jgi:hypothetical protein
MKVRKFFLGLLIVLPLLTWGQIQAIPSVILSEDAGPVDPTDNANYVGRFAPPGLAGADDASVSTWTNANGSGLGDMTLSNTIIEVSGGVNTADFAAANANGVIADSDWDPVPGTDAFTVALRVGRAPATTNDSQALFSKAGFSFGSNGQFLIFRNSSNDLEVWVGGTEVYDSGSGLSAGDRIIVTCRTTGADVYFNGTKVADDISFGTVTNTFDTYIGAGYLGTNYDSDITISHVYIRTGAINDTEAGNLNTWMGL